MVDIGKILSKLRGVKDNKTNLLTGLGIEQVGKRIYLFFKSSNDDPKTIRLAKSTDGLEFSLAKVFKENYVREKIGPKIMAAIKPRADCFDNGIIEIEGKIKIDSGNLVVYHNRDKAGGYQVGVAILKNNKVIFRGEVPLWESSSAWVGKLIEFIGIAYIEGKVIGYWVINKSQLQAVIYPSYKLRNPQTAKSVRFGLKRVTENPIITPKSENAWEAFNTFNPAAVYAGGKVHILYRAQGYDYISKIGYASSKNGITIEERLASPAYAPREDFEWVRPSSKKGPVIDPFASGGGFGGVEDPRITLIGERIYMLYVAYNGMEAQRIALTSITVEDFLNHRWLWEKPVLISPPGVVDKGPAIFPEKINGKYVILHRVYPDILIDFVDNLAFEGENWLKGEFKIKPRKGMWDACKIGTGAPPIKTEAGWLLIYYGTQFDYATHPNAYNPYMVGAMLLDLKEPTKVLHRSKLPILKPTEKYENEGFKAGILFPCGAVVINGTLFVYYGSADSYVCVATANLDEFLKQLTYTETPILEPTKIIRIS